MYRFLPVRFFRGVVWAAALMVLGPLPAAAQTLWAPSVDLYLPPQPPGSVLGSVGQPTLGMDQNGNAMAIWSDWLNGTNSVVRVARFDAATQTWSPSTSVSPVGLTATEARIAVAPNGDAVAVWQLSMPPRQVLQVAHYTASLGTWSTPANLSGATDDDVQPEVDVDGTGNAILVWTRRSAGFRIFAARYTAATTTWSAASAISAASVEAFYPHVAIDTTGNALTVWASTVSASQSVIKSSRYTASTTTWSAPVDVSASNLFAFWPDLAVDSAGNGVAIWTYGNRLSSGSVVQAAVYTGGTWGVPATLSDQAAATASPHVAVDDTGVATAVWQVDTGVFRLVQAARYQSGAWSGPHPLSSPPAVNDAGEPRVAMDGQGRAVAVWRAAGANSRFLVRAAFFDPAAGTWSAGAELSAPGDQVSEAPAVVAGVNRQAVAAWRTALSDMDHAKASHATLPDVPTLAAPAVNFPNVTLSWTPPASGPVPSLYTIVASSTPGGPPIAQLPVGTNTSTTVAAPAGTYYVRIHATMGGDIVPSNEVVVVVAVGPVPTAPRDLAASVSGSIVTLTWNPPANASTAPVQTYFIEAGDVPGAANLANFATGNATTSYMAAVPNGNYYVRVRASRVAGLGPPSAEVRVIVGPPPPSAPTLTGSTGAGGNVSLTWTVPTSGSPVTGYRLVAGTQSGGSDAAVIDFPASQLGFAAAGVPPGTYYVRVMGLSTQGPGVASNEVTLVVP